MADFDTMTIQTFKLWSEKALRSFLAIRKKSIEGGFEELAARAFIAWEEKVPVNVDAEHKERALLSEYKSKLIFEDIILPDPLALKNGWLTEKEGRKLWPPIYITDIMTYLELTCPQELVKQVLNEYKLGKAYRYFSCGWTKEIFYHSVRSSCPLCLLTAKVMPSMSLSSPAYNVWIAVQKSSPDINPGGKVMAAYCNCTAGMLGSCNHIASVLFKVEYTMVSGAKVETCTSLPCLWNVPKGKVSALSVDSVTWKKDHFNKQRPSVDTNVKEVFSPCSDEQLAHLSSSKLSIREKLCDISARCVPESRFRQLTLKKNIPSSSMCATESKCPLSIVKMALSYQDINKFTADLKFTQAMCNGHREATTSQHLSAVWAEHREGRITASNFHRVQSRYKTLKKNPSADPTCLISTIMGYKKSPLTLAMKHGISSEPHAKKLYKDIMKTKHRKFTAVDMGICVLPDKPYISASVDLAVGCECCGLGLCEIKCPETIKAEPPTPENVSFVEVVNGQLSVKKVHPYYSQIQGQMGVLGRNYCDLFIFTFYGSLSVRVLFDQMYWQNMLECLDSFWKLFILPELFNHNVKQKLQEVITVSTVKPSTSSGTQKRGHGPDLPEVDIYGPKKRQCHTDINLCCVCAVVCSDNPKCFQDESVQCSECFMWCHFLCAQVNDSNIPKDDEDWACPQCAHGQ